MILTDPEIKAAVERFELLAKQIQEAEGLDYYAALRKALRIIYL
jgi:hypothetical protein